MRALLFTSVFLIASLALSACAAPSPSPVSRQMSSVARSRTYPYGPNIYVPEYRSNSNPNGDISVYGTQNNTPLAQIAGNKTQICNPQPIAVDSTGISYVAGLTGCNGSGNVGYVLSFSANANGNVKPKTEIKDADLAVGAPFSLAVDSSNDLFVGVQEFFASSTRFGEILVFPPGADGNVQPSRTITSANMKTVLGLAVGSAGNTYAADLTQGVFVFGANANGNVSPIAHLKPPNGDWLAFGVAVHGQGSQCQTVVAGGWYTPGANPGDPAWQDYAGRVMIWNSCPANGTKDPDEYVTSAGLTKATGVAVDAAGNIYAANTHNNTIFEFAAGATGMTTPIRKIVGGQAYAVGLSSFYY